MGVVRGCIVSCTLTDWLDCSGKQPQSAEFSGLGLPQVGNCPAVIPKELLKASLIKSIEDQLTSSTPSIKNEMPPGRCHGRGLHIHVRRLQHQIATIKAELQDSNTGRFSKQSAMIRLPHHEHYAKVFRILFVCNMMKFLYFVC